MVEIRSTFHAELEGIRSDVVHLAALVTERIPCGTEVLLNRDLSEAQKLIEADDELDVLAIELEERCYQTLVLQAPMAGDMRAIISAIHLVSELERSGDLMVNVAKGMRRLYNVEIDPKLRGLISRMATEAQKLMVVAVD
ncbi:MAG: phosphate transport system regulatory protein PhoU, partial [Acidimicrobiales bacterium]|nr:phosphate transport system regulatory protein PhoU [Acidimicrobiales bacterium]